MRKTIAQIFRMNAQELIAQVENNPTVPPSFENETQRCLWLAGTGAWEEAHDFVESLPEPSASWIHALLHREEGDLGNASYWYGRAGKPMPESSISMLDEWKEIVKQLLP